MTGMGTGPFQLPSYPGANHRLVQLTQHPAKQPETKVNKSQIFLDKNVNAVNVKVINIHVYKNYIYIYIGRPIHVSISMISMRLHNY